MAYQSGKVHVNSRRKQVETKKIKPMEYYFFNCKWKCCQKFNKMKQEKIFLDFCKLVKYSLGIH